MTEAERNKRVSFRVNSQEWEVITRAARLEQRGASDLPEWLREIVVEKARQVIEQQERNSLAATLKDVGYEVELPSNPEPAPGAGGPCGCGHTQDPRGDCDGSCVMLV